VLGLVFEFEIYITIVTWNDANYELRLNVSLCTFVIKL